MMCASICRIPLPETKQRTVIIKITSMLTQIKAIFMSVMGMMEK